MATPIYLQTDLGNAKMFADLFKNRVAYDHQAGCWMVWDGTHWKADDSEEVYRLAANVPHIRQRDAALLKDPVERKAEFKWGLSSESANRLDAIVKYGRKQDDIWNTGKGWDPDPFLLGCQNGVIDLRVGRLIKAKPEMGITKQVHIKYDPDAECPTWIKALNSYWPADGHMVDFIQRAVGYSLTGSIAEQCLFFLFGKGGNGKNTFVDVLEELLGDYADVVPFSAFEFQSRTQISNDVAAMRGKRLLIASETQEDVRLNEGRIKSLTGDRKARARKLYEENLSFVQTYKIWWAANEKPPIRDSSDGIWRRLMMVAMDQQFKAAQRIKGLEDILIDKELSGILNWALTGCLSWLALGLEPTDRILGEVDKYRAETNPLQEFFEECVEKQIGALSDKASVYETYLEHCKANGEKWPLSRKQFARRMTAMGIAEKVVRTKNGLRKCWTEIVTTNRNGLNFNVSVP